MKSRGSMYALGAGARRGLVLLWTAVLLCSMLLQYVVAAAPAPVIAASGLLAGTVAGFEVDGDLKSGNAASNPGNIPAGLYSGLTNAQDWLDGNGINGLVDPASPPESFLFRDAVDKASVPGDVAPDTSAYVGGNKEFDTTDWGYFNNSGPNDKTDYRHVMAGVKVSGGNPYVFLGAERIDTTGTMVVDFELNQKPFKVFPGAPGVSKPDRSINDILISLEYANGGSNPEVTLYRVSAVAGVQHRAEGDLQQDQRRECGERRPFGDQLPTLPTSPSPRRPTRAGLCVGRGLGQHRLPRPARDLPQLRPGLHPQPDRRLAVHVGAQGRQPALPADGQHLRPDPHREGRQGRQAPRRCHL